MPTQKHLPSHMEMGTVQGLRLAWRPSDAESLLQACEAAEEELTGVFLTHLENWACRRRAVEAIALDSQAAAPSFPVLASRS